MLTCSKNSFGLEFQNFDLEYNLIIYSLTEIRGTSKGLLRTSFLGCQLHDITLPTTRAEKMLWLNRKGEQVINNSTHKYVYGEITRLRFIDLRLELLSFPKTICSYDISYYNLKIAEQEINPVLKSTGSHGQKDRSAHTMV